jgi:hypothetical protein
LVPLMKNNPKHKYYRALLPGLILCFGSFVYAAETFSTASLLDERAWTVDVYGRGVKVKPSVRFSGSGGVSVPTTGGSAEVFSATSADVKMDQTSSDITVALNARPHEGLIYSLYAGQVQDFKLEFSSGSNTNSLRSTSNGWRWGLGVGGVISPMSPVSTGVSWNLSYTQTNVNLDRFQGGDVVSAIDESIQQQEFQGALQAIRRWKMLEPYVGLKLIRLQTRLQDNTSKQRVSGHENGVSPMVGLRWAMFEKEFLQLEASFVDEKSVTAGVVVQF